MPNEAAQTPADGRGPVPPLKSTAGEATPAGVDRANQRPSPMLAERKLLEVAGEVFMADRRGQMRTLQQQMHGTARVEAQRARVELANRLLPNMSPRQAPRARGRGPALTRAKTARPGNAA